MCCMCCWLNVVYVLLNVFVLCCRTDLMIETASYSRNARGRGECHGGY